MATAMVFDSVETSPCRSKLKAEDADA
jgi:hypothetical protein